MNQLMRQAKKLQDEMMKAQAALAEREIEGSAGGGVVKVRMNGHKEPLAIEIAKDVVNPDDVEMLQDLVLAALQDALKQVDELAESELGKYTRGLNLPGLF